MVEWDDVWLRRRTKRKKEDEEVELGRYGADEGGPECEKKLDRVLKLCRSLVHFVGRVEGEKAETEEFRPRKVTSTSPIPFCRS